jgi:hypothetical protein
MLPYWSQPFDGALGNLTSIAPAQPHLSGSIRVAKMNGR